MRLGARRRREKATPCVQPECFDQLTRSCVACSLFRTPEPSRASGLSSQAPGTALQPQESVGVGAGPETLLPLPGLLFGAPVLLGLALALAVTLMVLVRWRQHRTASPKTPEGGQDGALDNVYIPSPGTQDASAPTWPGPREDPGTTPPGHSVPVPATELGSTELVTTKTAGPEQQ
ncbi:tumor necrosis factor receptor superfamily member 13C [Ctenodactylus gundi]